jgi:hypothetical protein
MLRDLLGYSSDLILYYVGRNDRAISGLERYPGPRLWEAGRLNFLRHWFLYKRVQLRMLLLPVTDVEKWVTWSNGWARTYRENLVAMSRDASGAGVQFVAISQMFEQMTSPVSLQTPYWYGLLRQYDALAIQRDVVPPEQFVDVRAAFGSDLESLFNDEVHLTPRGNDVLARAVAGALKERGMVPR